MARNRNLKNFEKEVLRRITVFFLSFKLQCYTVSKIRE
jgi:hypothetical protein